jgi:hypothetical protein
MTRGDDMSHDYDAVRLHRKQLDDEIDMICTERLLAADGRDVSPDGLVGRARKRTGRALIAAGTALVGREQAKFGTRRV